VESTGVVRGTLAACLQRMTVWAAVLLLAAAGCSTKDATGSGKAGGSKSKLGPVANLVIKDTKPGKGIGLKDGDMAYVAYEGA